MHRLVLFLFAFPLLAYAGDATPRPSASSVLIPASGGGGRLSIWSSGSVVAAGDGWALGTSGRCQFRVVWVDVGDDLHTAAFVWSVDLPAGRFFLDAEKEGEQIVLTITRLGEYTPLLKSGPFGIEYAQRVDGHAQF